MTKAKLQTLMCEDWVEELYEFFQTKEFKILNNQIVKDRKAGNVYPAKENIFRVFNETPLSDVRVVILGQDPYHNSYYDGRPAAIGRAFALDITGEMNIQPSLKNIIKELESDIGPTIGFDFTLQHWVDQGVLLLNTALTVKAGVANSHAQYWSDFTKSVMKTLNKKDNLVFILWGKHAQSYRKYLNNSTHKFIESPHPSPFSAHNGFFGSKPFSRVNKYTNIDWIGSRLKWTMDSVFIPQEEIEIIPPKTDNDE